MSYPPRPLGLSLSGGGYRASAFHLGTLKKLHQLALLEKVSVISTISGGSITGAYYCLRSDTFEEFEKDLYDILNKKDIVKKVLLSWTFIRVVIFALLFLAPAFWSLFTPYAWAFPLLVGMLIFLLLKFQFQLFPVSKRIEKIYDKFLYHKMPLTALRKEPILAIGSTNLDTSRPFVFSKEWMGDSDYSERTPKITFNTDRFPIARAVMASSCVPFAFTPVTIAKQFFTNPAHQEKVNPILVDGGVYDNQGIHKLSQPGYYYCKHIITSDAGGSGSSKITFRNAISLLITTVDVFMSRIKKVQMVKDVYDNAKQEIGREIAYLSLGWNADECIPGYVKNLKQGNILRSVSKAHGLKDTWLENPEIFEEDIKKKLAESVEYGKLIIPNPDDVKVAQKVGTNLTTLSAKELQCLMDQAACLTELQVKLYCPSLIPPKHD